MTPFSVLLFQFYPLLLLPLLLQSSVSHKIPRLSTHNKEALILRNPDDVISTSAISKDSKTHFYTQTLDHFNYAPQSYATFRQRYVVNSKYWGGPSSNSPIFAYLGAEAPLDEDLEVIGFLNDNAPHFKSLSVYIEHRFYGKSVPFGSMEKAMKNGTLRGYFSSAQAIADYAEVLLHVKHKFAAHYSPIIVVGGSYGGKLASWFRLKYPHIALGALASSAPILYFDNITPQNGYYSIVTKDFKTCSEIVMQIGRGENDTMFPAYPFDLHEFIKTCKDIYGIPPRPHWITTYYGGHDIKLILSRFGSNIIFSNGLRDPYSSGGVLEDLSESIVAVTTPKGSHCLDILNSDKTDPDWLIMQRKKEIEIEDGLKTYYADILPKRYI
ncbi:UNVERIFIED_CONTAM: Lysosomal Pro-X carboxypeptidase [Sesamum calycinum]|uniref:Lysosomal Pro-X carboxypeptidase n=1 Tax=Sesamum calycinum TaxID=2727403 RepID=A0AAW2SE39_9LAMI